MDPLIIPWSPLWFFIGVLYECVYRRHMSWNVQVLQRQRRFLSLKRTTGPGIPRRPSGPGFPAGPWGPTGPVLPAGPSVPDSPWVLLQRTKVMKEREKREKVPVWKVFVYSANITSSYVTRGLIWFILLYCNHVICCLFDTRHLYGTKRFSKWPVSYFLQTIAESLRAGNKESALLVSMGIRN